MDHVWRYFVLKTPRVVITSYTLYYSWLQNLEALMNVFKPLFLRSPFLRLSLALPECIEALHITNTPALFKCLTFNL